MPPADATLPPPTLKRSLASLFYELLLVAALLLTVTTVLTPLQMLIGQDALFKTLLKAVLAIALFGYFGYCWVRSGQTVAMKTWRIKLVNAHGGGIVWKQAAVRYLVGMALFVGMPAVSYLGWANAYGHQPQALWLALSWCLIPFLAKFYDRDKLFLHDRLAGTRQIVLPKPPHPGKKRRGDSAPD